MYLGLSNVGKVVIHCKSEDFNTALIIFKYHHSTTKWSKVSVLAVFDNFHPCWPRHVKVSITSAFYFDKASALEVVSAVDVDNGRGPPPAPPGSGPGQYPISTRGGGGYHLCDHQIGSHGHHHGLADRNYNSYRSSGGLYGCTSSREPRINIRKDYIIGQGINTSSNLNNSSSTNRRTSTGLGLLGGPNYTSCIITGRHHSTPVASSVVNSSHPPPPIPPQPPPSLLPPPPPTGSSIVPHHHHHHHTHHHTKTQPPPPPPPPPLTASQNLPPPPPSNAIIGNTAHCNSDTRTGSTFDSRYYGVMNTGAIDPSLPRTRSSSYRKGPCYQGYNASNATLDCSGVDGSENTVLASGMDIDDQDADPNHPQNPYHHRSSGNPRVRALNQVISQQRRSLRYRSSSQPLMKASSLIIGLVAVLIIGFIVLSPLFHILLP
ncbi:uncharacterized protein LOC128385564 [Panonychus citri]|uniref:uncharacterized protein LOC128385564 n=1 Tax=Panonychus citri TaxID=50023 RepID=UPI002307F22E|nr:uncharacterized protein LOC128385564 [Panonychus citri]